MQRTFILYSDPAHGWLKVKNLDLVKLHIVDSVSSCSYMRGAYSYLEEDKDLSLFMRAYKEKYGCDIIIKNKTSNNRSKVRAYENFNALYVRKSSVAEKTNRRRYVACYGIFQETYKDLTNIAKKDWCNFIGGCCIKVYNATIKKYFL